MKTIEPTIPARDDFLKMTLTRKQNVIMDVMYEMKKNQMMSGLLLANIGTSEMMLVTVKMRLIVKEMMRIMKLRMNHDDQYKALDNPIIFIDSVRRDSRSIVMFWNILLF